MINSDRLRQGRVAKAVEEAVAREIAIQDEADAIAQKVSESFAAYDEAYARAKAVKQDDPTLWRVVGQRQQAALNILKRKDVLRRHLGETV